jgi:hypothetical protein
MTSTMFDATCLSTMERRRTPRHAPRLVEPHLETDLVTKPEGRPVH